LNSERQARDEFRIALKVASAKCKEGAAKLRVSAAHVDQVRHGQPVSAKLYGLSRALIDPGLSRYDFRGRWA